VMTNADADAAAMDAAGANRARSFTVSPTSDAALEEDLRTRERERAGQARRRGDAKAEATTKRYTKNGISPDHARVSGGLGAHLEADSNTLAARSTPLSPRMVQETQRRPRPSRAAVWGTSAFPFERCVSRVLTGNFTKSPDCRKCRRAFWRLCITTTLADARGACVPAVRVASSGDETTAVGRSDVRTRPAASCGHEVQVRRLPSVRRTGPEARHQRARREMPRFFPRPRGRPRTRVAGGTVFAGSDGRRVIRRANEPLPRP
jgi:hypothetical protein